MERRWITENHTNIIQTSSNQIKQSCLKNSKVTFLDLNFPFRFAQQISIKHRLLCLAYTRLSFFDNDDVWWSMVMLFRPSFWWCMMCDNNNNWLFFLSLASSFLSLSLSLFLSHSLSLSLSLSLSFSLSLQKFPCWCKSIDVFVYDCHIWKMKNLIIIKSLNCKTKYDGLSIFKSVILITFFWRKNVLIFCGSIK